MIEIVNTSINVERVIDSVASPSAGAIDIFIGTTRNNSGGENVLYLEYEVYQDMALETINKLINEAYATWNLCKVSFVHRVGRVDIGEASIVIAVSSPHRKEAFEACRFLIDNVKKTVPIWKKEYFDDDYNWVEGEQNKKGDGV